MIAIPQLANRNNFVFITQRNTANKHVQNSVVRVFTSPHLAQSAQIIMKETKMGNANCHSKIWF